MTAHTVQTQEVTTIVPPRRRSFIPASLLLRIILALVVSWFIVMAFFATAALSH